MKKFFFSLLFMGGCLVFLVIGFFSGQLASQAANQGVWFETNNLRIKLAFNPEASELEKSISVYSLSLYAEVLSRCLSEPEEQEKITSARILGENVTKSWILNTLRSQIKKREKTPDGGIPDGKQIL